jgi:hypothetical protein
MRRFRALRLSRAAPRAVLAGVATALLAPGHAPADGKYSSFGPYSTWAAAGLTGQCAKTDGSGHFVQADNFTVYPLNGICEDVQGAWVRVPADGDKSWAYYCDSGSRPRMLNQSVEFDHWTLATSGVGFSPNSPSPSADVFDIDVHNWNTVFGDAWHYRGLYACVRYTVAGQPGYGGTQRGDFYSPNGGPDPVAMQNGFSVLCQSGPGVSIYEPLSGNAERRRESGAVPAPVGRRDAGAADPGRRPPQAHPTPRGDDRASPSRGRSGPQRAPSRGERVAGAPGRAGNAHAVLSPRPASAGVT